MVSASAAGKSSSNAWSKSFSGPTTSESVCGTTMHGDEIQKLDSADIQIPRVYAFPISLERARIVVADPFLMADPIEKE